MQTLLISTRNNHKVEEIRAILGEGFSYLALDGLKSPPEVIEDAGSFAGNASKKSLELARFVARTVGSLPAFVLADDSGLEVDALGGAPGVHSARFAALDTGQAGNSSNAENNAKLLRLLKDVPAERRTARFRCVLALTPALAKGRGGASPVCYADEAELQTEVFEGSCEGHIGFALRGERGFGYDPLFVPAGHKLSFAELGDEIKNRISHRAKALAKLKKWLDRWRASDSSGHS
jgi:XTP/dITP diphosphohydrolase